jgi:alkanesulfonate monooxygenase SsuD/methylene tetrahydromethanopterin reductase-like flavin-dependent oxidoreductase (luciferase family)
MVVDGSLFDFAFIPAGPIKASIELIELGERLGYRGVWIPDQGFHRDPFVVAGQAASRTSRIQIGLGITSRFTRLPVQIARAAATVEQPVA